MANTTDLAGDCRLIYGWVAGSRAYPIVDIGAYETRIKPKGTVVIFR
jgi:hypothetical protein